MKKYQIKDVSELLGISAYTLRYYEKIGLLSFVKRNAQGVREFAPDDLLTINTIICLKKTGMPLKEIKAYLQLVDDGIESVAERRDLFLKQKQQVLEQITALQNSLHVIDRKIKYYDEAERKHRLDVCQEQSSIWLQDILAGKEKVQ